MIEKLFHIKMISNKFQETERLTSDKILKNKSSIYTLENLRDTLLPKLMGGTVRVILENNIGAQA